MVTLKNILILGLVANLLVGCSSAKIVRQDSNSGISQAISRTLSWNKQLYGGFHRDKCFIRGNVNTIKFFMDPHGLDKNVQTCNAWAKAGVAHVVELGLAFDVRFHEASETWYAEIVGDNDTDDCGIGGDFLRWEEKYKNEGRLEIEFTATLDDGQKLGGDNPISERMRTLIWTKLKAQGELDSDGMLVSYRESNPHHVYVLSKTSGKSYLVEVPMDMSGECALVFSLSAYRESDLDDSVKAYFDRNGRYFER